MCLVIISIPNSRSADYFQQLVGDQRAKIALPQASVASLEEELDACQNDLKLCGISSSGLRQEPTVFKFYTDITVETFDHVKQLLGTPPLSMNYTGRKAGEHAGKNPSTPKEDCLQMTNCFSHWSNCGTTFPSSTLLFVSL